MKEEIKEQLLKLKNAKENLESSIQQAEKLFEQKIPEIDKVFEEIETLKKAKEAVK